MSSPIEVVAMDVAELSRILQESESELDSPAASRDFKKSSADEDDDQD